MAGMLLTMVSLALFNTGGLVVTMKVTQLLFGTKTTWDQLLLGLDAPNKYRMSKRLEKCRHFGYYDCRKIRKDCST